ncbi:16S rRNA (uracil(1498)-N(3))-methyltransferase [Shouchella lehensis]|uniref:Ribosomal RNA small subunit methyltransferase E n=2 Tax=Shouchella lehensis TaxID=300825 RepID=A0A060M1W7_9BACI|nr:16S rRNA (uracil(1498)-N(3))-methyltransferase [Shouchella lehensis]AIC94049.1 ribosomal RNA small subunit methyltransferase E [Shouchella lehensis G1]MBG9785683.1 16S rRNA methyltransferase [Shouchella lehensis]RQW19968.1 16S rRNA (uracil(1498)-N(3))-methyltransferase [Bacillus sp. C1-1]TES48145.1 16S rRNA (uracil(1498)-N(3))-methyltransferase [Shouchella lehensis]
MQRYFIANKQMSETQVTVTGEDAAHIRKVMRMAVGDAIICVNETGRAVVATITALSEDRVSGDILSEETKQTDLPVYVTLAQGLPKGDKFEYIIQKATELGVHAIIPFIAERSIVKWDEKKMQKKLVRFEKIAKEAAEQSHRSSVPTILSPLNRQSLVTNLHTYDLCLVCDEDEAKKGGKSVLKEQLEKVASGMRVLIIVGPEGGMARQEVDQLTQAGAIPCSLGPRILRTETASLYMLAALSYQVEL